MKFILFIKYYGYDIYIYSQTILLSVFLIIVSCNNNETESENKTHNTVSFPKYSTVLEMLEAAHDFKNECLEMLSKEGEPVHVRVSSEHLNNEANKELKDQVKRDIIYVVFQAFAETDIEEITVTSIPIKRTNFNPNKKYDGKLEKSLKQTVTVNRKRAKEVLNKRFEEASFRDLKK